MTFTYQAPDIVLPAGTLRAWHGPQGTAFRECVAAEFDKLAVASELVGDARNPLKCDATVLPYHAADRKIRRYSTESELSWRTRLAKWKQIWRFAGHAYGILSQLRILYLPLGRPRMRYVHTAGDGSLTEWFTLEPGTSGKDYFLFDGIDPEFSRTLTKPGNWIWDPQATAGQWSRYGVIIYTSGITNGVGTTDWDDDGEWDGGSDYWDGFMTSDQIADGVQLCTDWQAAGSAIYWFLLAHDDTAFDPAGSGAGYPDGTWNNISNRRSGVTYSYVRLAT